PRENLSTVTKTSHAPQENMAPAPVQARLNGNQRGHRPSRFTSTKAPIAPLSAVRPNVAWVAWGNWAGGRPNGGSQAPSRCNRPIAVAIMDAALPRNTML